MLPKQLTFLKKNNVAVLTTSNKTGKPRSIFVEINKATKDTIIITDNEMKVSKENILTNPQVFILASNQRYQCLKITGIAKYYNKGKYFEYVKKLPTNKNHHPKGAIVVTIKKVEESC